MDPIEKSKALNQKDEISLDILPEEIKLEIAERLDIKSLVSLSAVNREWRRIVSDEKLFPKQYVEDFPELSSRVLGLLLEDSIPKKETLLTRIQRYIASWFGKKEDEVFVPKEKLPAFKSDFKRRFLNELGRICLDYEVPKKLYTKTAKGKAAIGYEPDDVEKIKAHIQQRNDLSLCLFCRSMKSDPNVLTHARYYGKPPPFYFAQVELAKDDNNPEMITCEAGKWKEYLESIVPNIREIEYAIGVGQSPLLHLPPEIKIFDRMHFLNIDNRGLKSLPPEIGKLENLTTLGISGNELTSLPPEIGRLQQLEKLIIKNNINPIAIPKDILKCKALKHVDLSGTGLSPKSKEIIEELLKQNGIEQAL